jgi:hypothetical protein
MPQLRGTRRTDRGVGCNLRVSSAACALGDAEFAGQLAAKAPGLDAIDAGKRRRLSFDTVEKRGNARSIAADPQKDTLAVIENFAGKAELACNAPHGWAKTDALHASAHPKFERLRMLRSDGYHVTTGLAPNYMQLILMQGYTVLARTPRGRCAALCDRHRPTAPRTVSNSRRAPSAMVPWLTPWPNAPSFTHICFTRTNPWLRPSSSISTTKLSAIVHLLGINCFSSRPGVS